MTIRKGGPHPCLPGVPFVLLTLHSGMESETEKTRRKEYCTWKEIAKQGKRADGVGKAGSRKKEILTDLSILSQR